MQNAHLHGDFERIVQARHHDPFAVLGRHPEEDKDLIRAYLPGADEVVIAEGNLRLGGRLPNNTHGGQLSEAYIHGMNGVNEGTRVIRGTSTNQPEKNDHVLVTGGVGVPTSGMILGKMD